MPQKIEKKEIEMPHLLTEKAYAYGKAQTDRSICPRHHERHLTLSVVFLAGSASFSSHSEQSYTLQLVPF